MTTATETKVVSKQESLDYDLESLKHPEIYLKDVQEHIDAYKKLGVRPHEGELTFKAKCQAAEKVGLKRVTEQDIVNLLVKSKRYPEPAVKFRRNDDIRVETPFYDPLFDKTYNVRMPLFSIEPTFWSFQRWEPIHMVPMSGVKTPIPYGFLLRALEFKELNFFNCFMVFAPKSLVRSETYHHTPRLDPVLVATLVNRFTQGWNGTWRSNPFNSKEALLSLHNDVEFAHFFIGKW